MAADQQQRVDGWREPAGRQNHSTAIVDSQLYLWGGDQDGMPEVHDSAEKRQFFSSVEVFDVNTGCWEQRTTRGTPPLGVKGYSCVAVRNELHYFGGECGHSWDCYHNSVHTLSTSTLQWRMLALSTTEGGAPMQKDHCGMVHFTDGEEDLLYVVGGYGHAAPSSPQHRAQYQPVQDIGVRTNEQHIFSLSTNGWSSPVVTGQAPPPCHSFTLTTVGEKRAAMFGGYTQSGYSDDLYIVDLKRHSVNWSKIKKPVIKSVQWPERRYDHAASHITGTVFVMIGGYGGSRLSDVWLCDTNQWNKLTTLPHSVTERWGHSVSVFSLGARCVWVLVFGGLHYKAATNIIELIQDTSGQWCVERVMERETLSNNTEYQERLREGRIKGLLGDRASGKTLEETFIELYQESRQLQQQLQESEQSSQRRTREVEEEVRVLNDRLQDQVQQLLEDKRQHQLETEETLGNVQQQLTHEQAVTREKESEVHELQQQLAEKELKGHQLQQELTHEQAVSREKESEVQKLQQELTHEQAVSRLAHDDLLAAKMREEESQQLVVKLKEEIELIKEESELSVESIQTASQQRMGEKEEELQKSKQDLEYCQRRIREVEEKNKVLNDGLQKQVQQLMEDKRQHQLETEETLGNVQQQLTHEQAVTREKETEVHELQQQLTEKELKGHQLQQELTHEQAVTREKESEVHELQQQLTEKELKGHQLQQKLTHEQAVTREKESEVHKLQQQLTEKEMKGHQLQQELTHEQAVTREKESEVHKLQQKLENEQAASREKLTHEQAVSRLAHGDLLAAKMREEESQQLVVKLKEEIELIKEEGELSVESIQTASQQRMGEKEEESKQDLEYCQRRTREVEEEVRVLKDRPLLVQAGTQTDQDQLVKQHGTNIDEREETIDQESRQLQQQQLQESEQSYHSVISEVEEEEVRVTNDGLLQVHGQDQVKLQNDKEIEPDVQQVKQTDGLWQYLLLLSSFLFSRTAAASVLVLLVAVSIAVGPSRDLSPAATPPTPPSSSSSTQLHPVTSDKALLNEFPIVHITEPLTLCRCLTNVPYPDCKQLVGDYHMKTKTATTEILDLWFNQSPQLTWEDVVDTLFCYGLVNTAIPLANRHGVDWKPLHDKRKN